MLEGDFPKRPFFSCEEHRLVIVDGGAAKGTFPFTVEPWFVLERGAGNVLDSRPRKVVEFNADRVVVECDDGRLILDFEDGCARKETPDGQFQYLSGLDQANAGRGYFPVK